jgi:hypothetical protein
VELEVQRTVRAAGLPQTAACQYLDSFHLVTLTDRIMADAQCLYPPMSPMVAIHIATAQLFGPGGITVATHDAGMAAALKTLGILEVIDPVTDDAARPAVA